MLPRFVLHYSSISGSHIMAHVILYMRWYPNIGPVTTVVVILRIFPLRGILVLQISKSNKYSATMGIPAAFLKINPQQSAKALCPLADRFACADIPCQMVGSILHPLKKHKVSMEMGSISYILSPSGIFLFSKILVK